MCNPCTEVYMHHNHEDSTFPAKPRGNPSALFLTPAPRTRLNNGDSRGSTSRPVSLIHCLFVHIKLWCHTLTLPPNSPPLYPSTPPLSLHSWHFVGIIFFILGLGTLLPWNFFMTASLVTICLCIIYTYTHSWTHVYTADYQIYTFTLLWTVLHDNWAPFPETGNHGLFLKECLQWIVHLLIHGLHILSILVR